MVIMNQLVLIQRRITHAHLHSQLVHVCLHVIQAVHLVEDGEHVSVFPAQDGVFVEVHGWGGMVRARVGNLNEAAAFGGDGVPVGFCCVEGGGGFVVRGVAQVFKEFLLRAVDWGVVSAWEGTVES